MKARCILLLFVIALLVLGSGFQLSAQGTKGKAVKAADPHVGTWKMNPAKSKFNPGPPDKGSMVTITAQDNGGIKLVDEYVNADGKTSHAEFTAKFDGKDYPLIVDPDFDTIALNRIDATTWGEVLKKAGNEIESGRNGISKNGKTMTRTIKGKNPQGQEFNDTIVWDKQ